MVIYGGINAVKTSTNKNNQITAAKINKNYKRRYKMRRGRDNKEQGGHCTVPGTSDPHHPNPQSQSTTPRTTSTITAITSQHNSMHLRMHGLIATLHTQYQ
jgi:hypothetical protein